jgi:hypothetical protein
MRSAPHLPTACDRCDRAWLARPDFDQIGTCPFCDGPADVVPGESYDEADVALFETIASIVHDEQLSRVASHRLWATLSNVSERGRRPDRLLLPVVAAIPALQFVQEAFVRQRTQLARAAGMTLVAITAHLRALESCHRDSPNVFPR